MRGFKRISMCLSADGWLKGKRPGRQGNCQPSRDPLHLGVIAGCLHCLTKTLPAH